MRKRGAGDDRVKLLHGPYRAPALHIGDRATCLLRDCDVVITGWSDAPISWPRCRALDSGGGGSGLLLAGDLLKAVRRESAAAVRYWWGVSVLQVWKWRKALGVTRTDNPGSRRLILAASAKWADKTRGVQLPPEQVERRRRTAIERQDGRPKVASLRGGGDGCDPGTGRRRGAARAGPVGRLPDGAFRPPGGHRPDPPA
jgi:hypothetical protein